MCVIKHDIDDPEEKELYEALESKIELPLEGNISHFVMTDDKYIKRYGSVLLFYVLPHQVN